MTEKAVGFELSASNESRKEWSAIQEGKIASLAQGGRAQLTLKRRQDSTSRRLRGRAGER